MSFVVGDIIKRRSQGPAVYKASLLIEGTVPRRCTKSLYGEVESLFRPEWIYIADSSAPNFMIHEVLIGGKSQFPLQPTIFPVLAKNWTRKQQRLLSGIKFETMTKGLRLRIVVENMTDEPQLFRCEIPGRAILEQS